MFTIHSSPFSACKESQKPIKPLLCSIFVFIIGFVFTLTFFCFQMNDQTQNSVSLVVKNT